MAPFSVEQQAYSDLTVQSKEPRLDMILPFIIPGTNNVSYSLMSFSKECTCDQIPLFTPNLP